MNLGSLVSRHRTPDQPGPGPVPLGLLRAVELDVRRRIDGLLAGDFRASLPGAGTELDVVRPYVVGDDVREIDWNATARTGEPHVRVRVAERMLTTWLIIDVSASMSFGTAERRKADVAEGVAIAVGHLATRRGGRLGVMTFGSDSPALLPPTHGKLGLLRLLQKLREGTAFDGGSGRDLDDALRRAVGVMHARSAAFVVSDFIGPSTWHRSLLQLTGRHDVVAVEISDPREQELVDVGDVYMVDSETGSQVRVDTADAELRGRFAELARLEREEVARSIRRTRASHVVLSTAGGWLRKFTSLLATRGLR